ncbi:SNF2-related protein [Spirulina sp. CS-785/01]|uniref:helicase-related protein n=1 Tax=Spirulina sp. CS-785/01 TaxID=3021716 RepID=UPI00232C2BE9|nr:helicase-related protein [Spirulina sp. CS-785/01]MDB9313351.1 SNF2-related protein [Spirulina sp. CS-785/01]
MSNQELSWNPEVPNQRVRLTNSGREGVTTGKTRKHPQGLIVEIRFGPNEVARKKYKDLELCLDQESLRDLFKKGIYGKPSNLRQILTFEKVKGHLTNVFYSMESSNTDFYAYQFKPVMKFLDSPIGRILIADEVGLGKTIESMYIWKEIQAREDARRLIIICPSMLRDKWVNDLKNRFNLYAEVLKAKELFNKLQNFSKTGQPHSFIYVASLEGTRPPKNWDDQETKGTRAELARLLNQYSTQETKLFDLVIFDEAHYLRNPETANNKLARLFREASEHLILLTATPIQIRSDNLYQLLRLISPEDFYDSFNFQSMLDANRPIIQALSLIWNISSALDSESDEKINQAKQAIEEALQSQYFSNNSRLKQVASELEQLKNGFLSEETKVKYAQILESSSLFGQYMTRTRKRDVMERAKRSPQVLSVHFSELEKQIYTKVTQSIRKKAYGQRGVAVFSLIARQRQMASCMVAALKSWKKQDKLNDFLDNESEYDESGEFFWEDLGRLPNQSRQYDSNFSFDYDVDINELIYNDTKYKKLIEFLKDQLSKHPKEKFVLFAYFKGTLHYLKKRLNEDQITSCLIQGGMKREEKQTILAEFKNNSQIPILLSSEVGSEGIDLQFCRVLINYDLPWNPMRVEQRIGRLDRIGQTAKNISIINFSLVDTIEERILERLYERINIFKESIGDVEEILGDLTEQLLLELLNPNLNKSDRQKLEEQKIRAITYQISQQRQLENEAINLVAFSDYIFDYINKSRSKGRWLKPEELESFVNDYFQIQYPGTIIKPKSDQNHVFDIQLADEAKNSLKLFCQDKKLPVQTSLHIPNRTVTCFFDPKISDTVGRKNWELLDPSHPLIKWIANQYQSNQQTFYPVSALRLTDKQAKIIDSELIIGIYVYIIQIWQFDGLRQENKLVQKIMRLEDQECLSNSLAEELISVISVQGKQRTNAKNLIEDFEKILQLYDHCDELLQDEFFEASEDFKKENEDWCNVQENKAKSFHERKIYEIQERIKTLKAENKTKVIPAFEGQISKLQQNLQLTLDKIDQKRTITEKNPTLAAGLIFIEEKNHV